MSIATFKNLKSRLMVASKESPLAVFKVPGSAFVFNVVFASTIVTQKSIKEGDPDFIGTFHHFMNWDHVKREVLLGIS